MREADIQRTIIKEFEDDGWFVLKLIQTNKNGIMDLLCLKNSCAVFAEIKKPGLKPTDLQKYRADQLRKQGFEVLTLTSRIEAKCYLKQKNFA
jgi:Holliday junction resolvase